MAIALKFRDFSRGFSRLPSEVQSIILGVSAPVIGISMFAGMFMGADALFGKNYEVTCQTSEGPMTRTVHSMGGDGLSETRVSGGVSGTGFTLSDGSFVILPASKCSALQIH